METNLHDYRIYSIYCSLLGQYKVDDVMTLKELRNMIDDIPESCNDMPIVLFNNTSGETFLPDTMDAGTHFFWIDIHQIENDYLDRFINND